MNFYAHAVVAEAQRTDADFVLGSMLPDLAAMAGLRVAGAYRWPGPMHEGNGTWWSVVDRRASQEQIDALFTILGGQEQEPTTGFAMYAPEVRAISDEMRLGIVDSE